MSGISRLVGMSVSLIRQIKAQLQRMAGLKKELAIVLLSRVGIAGFSLLLIQMLLTVFDAEQFGLYTLIFSTASWLSILIYAPGNIPLTNFASNTAHRDFARMVFQSLAGYGAMFFVFVLTGAGDKAFCSGGDQRIRGDHGYREMEGGSETGMQRLNVLDFQTRIRKMPKPVIACAGPACPRAKSPVS